MKAAQPEEEEQVEHDEHIEDELEDDVYIVQKVLEHRSGWITFYKINKNKENISRPRARPFISYLAHVLSQNYD
jgi:hypothetical protein